MFLSKKLIILIGVLGISSSAVFIKFADAPSAVLVTYRNLLAFFMLLPFVLKNEREALKSLSKKSLLFGCLSGVFLAFHFLTYFDSVRFTSIASSNVLVSTEVFFVGLISFLFFKERIAKLGVFGILLSFIGTVIVAFSDLTFGIEALIGDFLAVVAALLAAFYTLIGKEQRKGMTATLYTFLVYGSCAFVMTIFCLVSQTPLLGYAPINYLMALCLTLVCTFLGHSIFNWGIKYESAIYISTAKLASPIFAIILGFIFFSEIPSLIQVLGGVFIIIGIYIYIHSES